MERMFPVWAKEQRLIKVNVRVIRYLDILLCVLKVVMGGKYTDVMEIIINLKCHILNIE